MLWYLKKKEIFYYYLKHNLFFNDIVYFVLRNRSLYLSTDQYIHFSCISINELSLFYDKNTKVLQHFVTISQKLIFTNAYI